MNPYFFGASDNPLFGIYTPPVSQSFSDTGVLMCHPIAQEYMRSYWVMRRLEAMLIRKGFHAFRFDYSGTGDSAGASEDGNAGIWTEDIRTAAQEMKDISGIGALSLVGLRMGATLAVNAISQGLKVRHLVLWDPVVNGARYLDQLVQMHAVMLKDPKRFGANNIRQATTGKFADQLLGYPFPEHMRDSIRGLDMLGMANIRATRISLIISEARDEYTRLKEMLEENGNTVSEHLVPGAGNWDDAVIINDNLLAIPAAQAICNDLAGK